jgi:hypothetical protein
MGFDLLKYFRGVYFSLSQNTKGNYTIHVFRLKRTKTKEPLGLVLVSGHKVSCLPAGVCVGTVCAVLMSTAGTVLLN